MPRACEVHDTKEGITAPKRARSDLLLQIFGDDDTGNGRHDSRFVSLCVKHFQLLLEIIFLGVNLLYFCSDSILAKNQVWRVRV